MYDAVQLCTDAVHSSSQSGDFALWYQVCTPAIHLFLGRPLVLLFSYFRFKLWWMLSFFSLSGYMPCPSQNPWFKVFCYQEIVVFTPYLSYVILSNTAKNLSKNLVFKRLYFIIQSLIFIKMKVEQRTLQAAWIGACLMPSYVNFGYKGPFSLFFHLLWWMWGSAIVDHIFISSFVV